MGPGEHGGAWYGTACPLHVPVSSEGTEHREPVCFGGFLACAPGGLGGREHCAGTGNSFFL